MGAGGREPARRCLMLALIQKYVDRYPDRSALPPQQREAKVTRDQLARACEKVLDQGYTLRDGRVMREALAIAEVENGRHGRIWGEVLDQLAEVLPEATFNMWIAPVKVARIEGGCLVLTAPEAISTWVERRYSELILRSLGQLDSDIEQIRFCS